MKAGMDWFRRQKKVGVSVSRTAEFFACFARDPPALDVLGLKRMAALTGQAEEKEKSICHPAGIPVSPRRPLVAAPPRACRLIGGSRRVPCPSASGFIDHSAAIH